MLCKILAFYKKRVFEGSLPLYFCIKKLLIIFVSFFVSAVSENAFLSACHLFYDQGYCHGRCIALQLVNIRRKGESIREGKGERDCLLKQKLSLLRPIYIHVPQWHDYSLWGTHDTYYIVYCKLEVSQFTSHAIVSIFRRIDKMTNIVGDELFNTLTLGICNEHVLISNLWWSNIICNVCFFEIPLKFTHEATYSFTAR